MSQQVAAWTSRIRRLRLSQVLEMYYLHQGISIPIIEANLKRKVFKGRKWHKNTGTNVNEVPDDIPASFDAKRVFKKSFDNQNKKLNEELLDVDIKYLSRFIVTQDISAVCHRRKILEMVGLKYFETPTN